PRPAQQGRRHPAVRGPAGRLRTRSVGDAAQARRRACRNDRPRGRGAAARDARRGARREDRRMSNATTVLASLNAGLRAALTEDARVVVLGEDVLDPYGGAFKVTRGLSAQFPDRVLTTPISEAGIVAVATGMALRGLRPVVEIMFGDFLFLAG